MSVCCEILSVGTELLLGNVANTDAQDLSQGLAELGINVFWHTVVGDNPQRLTECVAIARKRADIIITTGGLGPTYDDLTKNVLAAAFGKDMVFDEEEAEKLRNHFVWRGGKMTENNLAQAWLPEGCTKFNNTCGTAPGCAFEADGVTVIMLPGPPRECRTMFRLSAMPYLLSKSDVVLKSHNIHIFGMGESAVEAKLKDLMVSMTNPTLAPYAKTAEVMLRLTARGRDEAECEALMQPYLEDVLQQLGDVVYGVDTDSLEATVVALLSARGETISTAESCTGGLMGKRITDISGASAVYPGGVVSYSNEVKAALLGIDPALITENGPVSAIVARKMAEGVRARFGTDWGVGITGIAGPNSDETGTPVGTVFVAVSNADGTWLRSLSLGRDRERVRVSACHNAFDLLRRIAQGIAPNAEKFEGGV